MGTHLTPCAVCGEQASCASETASLRCGDGGCYTPGIKIEFCTEKCFRELHRRMLDRWRIYCELQKEKAGTLPLPLQFNIDGPHYEISVWSSVRNKLLILFKNYLLCKK